MVSLSRSNCTNQTFEELESCPTGYLAKGISFVSPQPTSGCSCLMTLSTTQVGVDNQGAVRKAGASYELTADSRTTQQGAADTDPAALLMLTGSTASPPSKSSGQAADLPATTAMGNSGPQRNQLSAAHDMSFGSDVAGDRLIDAALVVEF